MEKKNFLIFFVSALVVILLCFFSVYSPKFLTIDSGFDVSYGGGFSSSHSSSSSSSYSGDDKFTMFHIYFISFVIIDSVIGLVLSSMYEKKKFKIDFKFKIILYLVLFVLTFLFLFVDLPFNSVFLCCVSLFLVSFLSFFSYIAVMSCLVSDRRMVKVMTEIEVNQIDSTIDLKKFMMEVYDIYTKVQIAWMNFDYDVLRNLLSDELYNQYKMQLETLKIKNQKNIMKNFGFKKCGIVSIEKNKNTETIVAFLNVSMFDYIVDKDEKVVRGNKFKKINVSYLITLERGYELLNYCPQCGALVEDKFSQVCKYCNSVIVKVGNKFSMIKKEIIDQR